MLSRRSLAVLSVLILVGCNGFDDGSSRSAAGGRQELAREIEADELPAPGPARAGVPRVVFLGDSITFGLGLESRQQAWPAIIASDLAAAGVPIEAINAGLSGDTTAGGLARLPELLAWKPDVLVVALGGNDATHGEPADAARANLQRIVTESRAAGARVLLVGLRLSPRLAEHENGSYAKLWDDLARDLSVPEVPDMLDGVLDVPAMVQADGVHPTIEGQKRVASNVLPGLRKLLSDARAAGPHSEAR
jgi:acyl-CoA thioesterase-1